MRDENVVKEIKGGEVASPRFEMCQKLAAICPISSAK